MTGTDAIDSVARTSAKATRAPRVASVAAHRPPKRLELAAELPKSVVGKIPRECERVRADGPRGPARLRMSHG